MHLLIFIFLFNKIDINKVYNFIIKNSSDYDLLTFKNFEIKNHIGSIIENLNRVPWKDRIDEDLFLHYIIPPRVTQEPVENFSSIYKDTLFEIIKNVRDMREAVLKINEWCYTKMEYRPTERWDFNASTVIKSGYGRCEEMTILLIKALRTVCIPARFAYTPAWPFTESNHAWTEIWIDGSWHYIGSAELSDIDFPWFRKSVKRTSIVLSPVFGFKEERYIFRKGKKWCIINSTENYTDVSNIKVITTLNGEKIKNSIISFSVFNYSSITPIMVDTLESGEGSFILGHNEYFVFASMDSLIGYSIFFPEKEFETLYLQINKKELPDTSFILHCLKEESDTGKPFYFPNTDSLKIIRENNLKKLISEDTNYIFKNASGNSKKLLEFYTNLNEDEKKNFIRFFKNTNPKDLVFMDTINLKEEINTIKNSLMLRDPQIPDSITENYIIPERILFEEFGFYKHFLFKRFKFLLKKKDIPGVVLQWVKRNIKIDKDYNFFKPQQNPVYTYRLKKGSNLERYILIAGILRSVGIPAKISWDMKGVEYYDNEWKTLRFEETPMKNRQLKIKFFKDNKNITRDFDYYENFTIQEFNGIPKTSEPDIEKEDTIITAILDNNVYYFVWGFRNVNGDGFVNIKKIDLREKDGEINVYYSIPGEFKPGEMILKPFNPEDFKKIGIKINKGNLLISFVDFNSEASRTTIINAKNKLASFKGSLYFLGDEQQIKDFLKKNDIRNGKVINLSSEDMKKFGISEIPSFLYIEDGEPVFWIEGFSLHLEDLLK